MSMGKSTEGNGLLSLARRCWLIPRALRSSEPNWLSSPLRCPRSFISSNSPQMLSTRFVHGRSKFSDHSPGHPEPTAKIYVRVRFPGLSEPQFAHLDTGAAWSVLSPSLAQELGV